jgi:hypothetical protein
MMSLIFLVTVLFLPVRARVMNFPATSTDAAVSIVPSSARLKAFLQSTDTLSCRTVAAQRRRPTRGGAAAATRARGHTRSHRHGADSERTRRTLIAALRVQTDRAESMVNVAQRKAPVRADVWTHVAVVFDAPNRDLRLLVDGQLVAQAAVRRAMRLVRGLAGIVIAGAPLANADAPSFAGDVDEVRVWSTARADDDVARDFQRHYVDTLVDVRDFGLLMYLSANAGVSLDTSADAAPALPDQVLSGGANVRAGVDSPVVPRLGNATAPAAKNDTNGAAPPPPPPVVAAEPANPPERDSYHQRLSTSLADSHRDQVLGDIEKMDYAIDARHAGEIASSAAARSTSSGTPKCPVRCSATRCSST